MANYTEIEIRPREDGTFDEVVGKHVDMIHIETMDDGNCWMAIYPYGYLEVCDPPRRRLVINFWAKSKGKLVIKAEWD